MTTPAPTQPWPANTEPAAPARWRVERRPYVSQARQLGAILFALLLSLLLSAGLVALAGANIGQAFQAMLQGALGGTRPIATTLVEATPLLFTGLAVTVAFRAGVWNIGGEGQFIVGAICGTAVVLLWGGVLPPWAVIPLYLVAAIIGGALTAMGAGLLKVRFEVNEVIVTVMMNFILQYFLAFLLGGAWRDTETRYIQSPTIPTALHLPRLIPQTQLNLGLVLGLVTAALVYVLLWQNTLGYEIRAMGINPVAARYKGIRVAKVTLLVMALSGAIAGLGGAAYAPGLQQHLRLDVSGGFGYAGILIAMLGRLNPLGVIISAVFFGALTTGASAMQVATGVPVAIAQAIQGLTLVSLVVVDVLARYRLVRVTPDG